MFGLYWYKKRIRGRKWRLVDRYGNIVGKPSKEVMQGKVIPPLAIEDVNARKWHPPQMIHIRLPLLIALQ